MKLSLSDSNAKLVALLISFLLSTLCIQSYSKPTIVVIFALGPNLSAVSGDNISALSEDLPPAAYQHLWIEPEPDVFSLRTREIFSNSAKVISRIDGVEVELVEEATLEKVSAAVKKTQQSAEKPKVLLVLHMHGGLDKNKQFGQRFALQTYKGLESPAALKISPNSNIHTVLLACHSGHCNMEHFPGPVTGLSSGDVEATDIGVTQFLKLLPSVVKTWQKEKSIVPLINSHSWHADHDGGAVVGPRFLRDNPGARSQWHRDEKPVLENIVKQLFESPHQQLVMDTLYSDPSFDPRTQLDSTEVIRFLLKKAATDAKLRDALVQWLASVAISHEQFENLERWGRGMIRFADLNESQLLLLARTAKYGGYSDEAIRVLVDRTHRENKEVSPKLYQLLKQGLGAGEADALTIASYVIQLREERLYPEIPKSVREHPGMDLPKVGSPRPAPLSSKDETLFFKSDCSDVYGI